MREWRGSLRPSDVLTEIAQDADDRRAFYFTVVLPDPQGLSWDVEDLNDLNRAVRDKALEVHLPYPWYVLPRGQSDEPQADDDDIEEAKAE